MCQSALLDWLLGFCDAACVDLQECLRALIDFFELLVQKVIVEYSQLHVLQVISVVGLVLGAASMVLHAYVAPFILFFLEFVFNLHQLGFRLCSELGSENVYGFIVGSLIIGKKVGSIVLGHS